MSEMINVMGYANVIDNNHTLYNLSAWLGGYYDEDDSMTASLTFLNDLFQTIGTQNHTWTSSCYRSSFNY